MNLENLGLVELNAQEVQEVDGGWLLWWLDCGVHLGFHIDEGPSVLST